MFKVSAANVAVKAERRDDTAMQKVLTAVSVSSISFNPIRPI